jgi:hypothetical protein
LERKVQIKRYYRMLNRMCSIVINRYIVKCKCIKKIKDKLLCKVVNLLNLEIAHKRHQNKMNIKVYLLYL